MKLYLFRDPYDYRFARGGRRGTWSPSPGLCPECGGSRSERIPPLIIEWLPDSDQIGDFTWPGLNDEVVVTQRVREALEGRFRGFEFRSIEMYQNPRLKRPSRPTKRTKPRVWLPYEGPPLWDLQPTSQCRLDLERSGLRYTGICGTCGWESYEVPPLEGRYLVVDRSTWDGADIYRIHEYSALVYCTEQVKEFIESQGFTNVSFLLDGEIPD